MELEDGTNPYQIENSAGIKITPFLMVAPDSLIRSKHWWFEKNAYIPLVRSRQCRDGSSELRCTDWLKNDMSQASIRKLPNRVRIRSIKSPTIDLNDLIRSQDIINPDGIGDQSNRLLDDYINYDDLTPIDDHEKNLYDNPSVVSTGSKRYGFHPDLVNNAPRKGLERPPKRPFTERNSDRTILIVSQNLSVYSKVMDIGYENERMKRSQRKSLLLSQDESLESHLISKETPSKVRVFRRQLSKAGSTRAPCPNGNYSCIYGRGFAVEHEGFTKPSLREVPGSIQSSLFTSENSELMTLMSIFLGNQNPNKMVVILPQHIRRDRITRGVIRKNKWKKKSHRESTLLTLLVPLKSNIFFKATPVKFRTLRRQKLKPRVCPKNDPGCIYGKTE